MCSLSTESASLSGSGRDLTGRAHLEAAEVHRRTSNPFSRISAPTFVSRLRARPAIRRVRSISVRQGLKWKQLQSLVGTRAAIGAVQQLAKAHNMARGVQRTAQAAGAVLEVEYAFHAGDLQGAVPYWQQGDMELHTEDNLERRAQLRSDKAVLEVLQDWWLTAQHSMRSENQWSKGTTLGRDDYVRICVKIYKAMIQDYDEAEALECAQDDWRNDCKGEEELSRERFMDAMFELADVWTKTIDAAEYAELLPDPDRSPDRSPEPEPDHNPALDLPLTLTLTLTPTLTLALTLALTMTLHLTLILTLPGHHA